METGNVDRQGALCFIFRSETPDQFERIDEIYSGEEANLLAMVFNRLDAKRGSDMGLSSSRPTDQYGVMCTIGEEAQHKQLAGS